MVLMIGALVEIVCTDIKKNKEKDKKKTNTFQFHSSIKINLERFYANYENGSIKYGFGLFINDYKPIIIIMIKNLVRL